MEGGRHALCLALTLFLAGPAFAAEPPLAAAPPPVPGQASSGNLKELSEIMGKIRLKEAELQLKTLEAKIREMDRRIGPPDPGIPQVASVSGGNGKPFVAKIRFPDGSVYEAGAGSRLENGCAVIDANPRSVVIEMDGRRLILPVMGSRGGR